VNGRHRILVITPAEMCAGAKSELSDIELHSAGTPPAGPKLAGLREWAGWARAQVSTSHLVLVIALRRGPDGYRVEVYAHYWRHDVEKRRPAPLTR
jgi:hypothetical protein